MQKKHFAFLLIAIIVAATIDSCSKSSPSAPAVGSTPPTLTAAVSATVDNNFNITYTDDPNWDAAVTSVQVGGNTLSGTAWSLSAGVLTLKPSQSSFLQTARGFTITVLATGYNNDAVSQTIVAGAATKLGITTQPSAPTTNGGALVIHAAVSIKDQYGNVVASSASVTAAVGSGTWTLGGTTTVSAINGVTTFNNLTATSAAAVTGATITFSSGSLTGATSSPFNIPVLDTAAKYNADVAPILSANCYSCHNSGGIQQDGVILNTYNGVKAAISSGAFPDVLTGANGFPQMPDGAAPLSTIEINKIKSWVNDGAPNN